jgi:hypothetical protein
MFAASGISGQISGIVAQPCISGYISSGQPSPGWWKQAVRWGKAGVIPGMLVGVGVEIIKFQVPPHVDPPDTVWPIDLGPVTPPFVASGSVASGHGSLAC